MYGYYGCPTQCYGGNDNGFNWIWIIIVVFIILFLFRGNDCKSNCHL